MSCPRHDSISSMMNSFPEQVVYNQKEGLVMTMPQGLGKVHFQLLCHPSFFTLIQSDGDDNRD